MDYSVGIEDVIKAVKIEADKRKRIADYNGRMGDGGANILLNQVKFYEMGRNNEMPEEWNRYLKHVDPEYEEYLRLKKKFNA